MIDYILLKISEMALRAMSSPSATCPWVYWTDDSGITYYSKSPVYIKGWDGEYMLRFPPATDFMRPSGMIERSGYLLSLNERCTSHGRL